MVAFSHYNSIYVGNLDPRVKADDITEFLKGYVSDVVNVKVFSKNSVSSYAFVRFKNGKNILKILTTLKESEINLYQSKVLFSRVWIKKRALPISDHILSDSDYKKSYDMFPEDPSVPCIHVLVDDSLFDIFSYLHLTDLIRVSKVCRRFHDIAHPLLVKMLLEYQHSGICILEWFYDNGIHLEGGFDISISSKIAEIFRTVEYLLRNCGYSLKKIHIGCTTIENSFFDIIGQHCQNLEELSFHTKYTLTKLECIAKNCKKLKKISTGGPDLINEDFKFIFNRFKSLEMFTTYNSLVLSVSTVRCVTKSLKEFSCFGEFTCEKSPWKRFFQKCKQLEVFRLSTRMTMRELKTAAQFCPNMKELSIVLEELKFFDWSKFRNLTKLFIIADKIDLNNLALCESLEDLHIRNHKFDRIEVTGDFSLLKNLRYLNVSTFPVLDESSLETIISCQNLEYLDINISNGQLNPVLKCIKHLPKLAKLICTNIELTRSEMQSLIKIGKSRKDRITLQLKLYDPFEDELAELTEVYNIEMLDILYYLDEHISELDDEFFLNEFLDFDDDYESDDYYESDDNFFLNNI